MSVSYVYKLSWTDTDKHYIGYREDVDASTASDDLNSFSFTLPSEVQTYIASNGAPDTKTILGDDSAVPSNFVRLILKDGVYSNTALINKDILESSYSSANSFNRFVIDEIKTKILLDIPV